MKTFIKSLLALGALLPGVMLSVDDFGAKMPEHIRAAHVRLSDIYDKKAALHKQLQELSIQQEETALFPGSKTMAVTEAELHGSLVDLYKLLENINRTMATTMQTYSPELDALRQQLKDQRQKVRNTLSAYITSSKKVEAEENWQREHSKPH